MRPPAALDWVAGAWRPSSSGHEFQLDALLPPFLERGRWPRSAAADLADARLAAERGGAVWERMDRSARCAIMLAALDELERSRKTIAAALAPGLGQPAESVDARWECDALRAREGLELLRDGGQSRPGSGLFLAHWTDLVGPLLLRLSNWLIGGSTLVVIADPRLPEACELVARALEASGLPAGVVALLHDDGQTLVRSALESGGMTWLRARGSPAELDALDALARRLGAPGQRSLWPLASATHGVQLRADPAEEARRVLQRALGSSDTLCGQLPDAIGRVLCHQRQFSRFTAELLDRLERSAELARPFLPVESDLPGWMREAWALGLDEGACPIFGEVPARPAALPGADPGGAAAEGGPRGRAPKAIAPVVFTNVESGGRLAGLERPAPLLRLVRAESDEEVLGGAGAPRRAAHP
jgi:acyl-CoA reductase-like NAD-dependent aldehyde dehydrogenase